MENVRLTSSLSSSHLFPIKTLLTFTSACWRRKRYEKRYEKRYIHITMHRNCVSIPKRHSKYSACSISTYQLDLLHPAAHGHKRRSIRDVIDQQDALRTAEIRRGDRPEAFLSRGIPNLDGRLRAKVKILQLR